MKQTADRGPALLVYLRGADVLLVRRLRDELSKRASGARVTQAAVVRAALEKLAEQMR